MPSADAIVVGLGAVGSAALHRLSGRGVRALGIDRFAPPHEYGSTHGETRITRESIGEGDAYVPLVRRANALWREIEAESGLRLLEPCGGLVLSGARSQHPKKRRFLDETIAVARRHGIRHEVWSADEIAARYPQFILDGDERGYFEPGAGILHPELCVTAQLDLARRAGAGIRTNETVLSVEPAGEGVRVRTDRDTYEAGTAIVTAGAWTPGLVGPGIGRFTLERQVLTWFEVERPEDFAIGRFPVFIWLHGDEEQSYGFPIPPGTSGLKVASETYDRPIASPEDSARPVSAEETGAVFARHVAGRLRGVLPVPIKSRTCLYTLTPDLDFLIDRHPDSDRILIASACSGHGFKHSPAIGEALAQLALDGRSVLDLAPFRLRALPATTSRRNSQDAANSRRTA